MNSVTDKSCLRANKENSRNGDELQRLETQIAAIMGGRPRESNSDRWQYNRRMQHAEKTGDSCGHCGRDLKQGERVTLCRWQSQKFGRYRGSAPVCDDCMKIDRAQHLISFFMIAGNSAPLEDTCAGCNRPVVLRIDPRRRHVYCSERCYSRIIKPAVQNEPIPCAGCGERFTPARTDSRFCSSACRQKAYRARKADTDQA